MAGEPVNPVDGDSATPGTQSKSTILGDFQLKRKLGQGGMGTVYLAHQVSLDRDCALKVLSKELASKPGFVERFVREARSMARIDHPHVVRCFAVDQDRGYHFVAMELVDGRSLQDWLNHLGQLSVADSLKVAITCGHALHHAHELNMVHRDVKPDNILVTKTGEIKVSDLGLAKAIDEEDAALTQSGTGLGTPLYMAPEQARNAKRVDRRCDVYALGVTIYHFVTGQPPFTGASLLELVANKQKGQFPPARRVNPQVPERLSLMLDKAIAADPQHRYQTCLEFANDLMSLGLAAESLSFCGPAGSGSAPAHAVDAMGTTAISAQLTDNGTQKTTQLVTNKRTDRELRVAKKVKQGTAPADAWFVKTQMPNGKVKIGKMSTVQLIQAVRADKLSGQTQVSSTARGTFQSLVQVPVFEEEARRSLTRQKAHSRDQQLAHEYEKLARQYERQKWWRFLHRMVDGTLGIMGLLIWLALIAGIAGALYFVVPWIYTIVAGKIWPVSNG